MELPGDKMFLEGIQTLIGEGVLNTLPDKAVFWSTNCRDESDSTLQRNKLLAEAHAQANGCVTIQQLAGGINNAMWTQEFTANNPQISMKAKMQASEMMSDYFASHACGTISAYVNNTGPTSTFRRVELPLLMANNAVTAVRFLNDAGKEQVAPKAEWYAWQQQQWARTDQQKAPERASPTPTASADASLTQPLADIQISMALSSIARQLASLRQMGVSQEHCRELYARTLVEMVNAAGVDMYGKTFFNPAANAPKEVGDIAAQLGTQPTEYYSKLSVSHYERFSLGSSATIVQQDAKGQDHVLLVRTGNKPDEWTLPAGYMDPLPSGTATVANRLAPETQSPLEEALAAHKPIPQVPIKAAPGAMLAPTMLPCNKETKAALHDEYQKLLKEQGWQVAYDCMNDADYLRVALAGANAALPVDPASGKAYDLTPTDNIRREAKEETGLDLAALEAQGKARITPISTDAGLGASGGRRPMCVDSHFLVDLGCTNVLPALKPEDPEIIEAKWVPLSCIERDAATGNYIVEAPCSPAIVLGSHAIPHIEYALNALLESRLREASGERVGSVSALRAQGDSWQGRAALSKDITAFTAMQAIENPPPQEPLPSLVGPEGQALLQTLPLAAATLADAQDAPSPASQADSIA